MRLKREKTHEITEYLKTKGPRKTKDNMIQQVIKDQVRSDYSSNIYKLLCFQLFPKVSSRSEDIEIHISVSFQGI